MDKFDRHDWYLWPCAALPGAYSMAADHYLARQMGGLLDRPLLRFFTWQPYCVSLGYHQDPSQLDAGRLRKRGYHLVRRPTGGRAILHAEELTYSVVYPFSSLEVNDFYRLVHTPFVEALNRLGVPACFQQAQADFRQFYQTDKAAACFATSAQFEVELEGKKLIGSAQRVYENAILQHGSLLLGERHMELVDLLYLPADKRGKMHRYLKAHTATVWQVQPGIGAGELAGRICAAFSDLFGIRFTTVADNPQLVSALKTGPQPDRFNLQSQQTGAQIVQNEEC